MPTLHDLFISHDAIAVLRRFVKAEDLSLPEFERQLDALSKRSGLTYSTWWQLLESLDAQLDRPALGSIIGAGISPKESGILGYLTQTSLNMLEALHCFERFQRLIYEGNNASIKLESGLCYLDWEITHGHSTQLSDEVVFSSLLAILRQCVGDASVKLHAVSFAGAAMASDQFYQDYYGCEVKFNQPHLSMIIDSQYLLQPFCSSDPTLHSLLLDQAQTKLPEDTLPDPFMHTLEQAIMRSLHEGRPTAQQIAKKLNMSSRTLHRRLDKQGLVFREILRDIRKQLAADYLSDNHLRLTEIALLLGYSEQSAFSRAFVEWFDMPPSAYPANHVQR